MTAFIDFITVIFSLKYRDVIMTKEIHIEFPKEGIEEFCKKHHIRKLSLFGSALRDDFAPESDMDKYCREK